jgi:hypothetical protein
MTGYDLIPIGMGFGGIIGLLFCVNGNLNRIARAIENERKISS